MARNLKTIVTAIALFGSLISPSQAVAGYKVVPYLGAGYQLNHIQESATFTYTGLSADTSDYLENDFNNLNLFAGFGLKGSNFALEFGYFNSKWRGKSDTNTGITWPGTGDPVVYDAFGITVDSQLKILNIDIIYNHKIFNHDAFKVLAVAGVSKAYFDSTLYLLREGALDTTVYDNEKGYGWDAGVGLEADITDNLSVRTIVKYTSVNNLAAFDTLLNYTAGFKYHF
jgi:outer membrane autotransporter protein